MATPRLKKRRIKGHVQEKIEVLALRRRSAKQIYDQLSEDEDIDPDDLPTLRTVERIVNDVRPRDTSAPWSLADSDADNVPAVLETLAAVIEFTEGRVTHLTRAQATWIARIRRAAPDLALWRVYLVAMMYQKEEEKNADASGLDAYLAFAPWRSREDALRYQKAFQAGYIRDYYMFRLNAETLAESTNIHIRLSTGGPRKEDLYTWKGE